MKAKRILAIFVSLFLLCSFGIAAFADNTWTAVPTSPDNLPNGSYYLDFDAYIRIESGTVDSATLALLNAGSWFVDFNQWAIKGEVNGIPAQKTSDPRLLYALRKTGIPWLPVATSVVGLQDKAYYFDLNAYIDDHIAQAIEDADPSSFDEAAEREELENTFKNCSFWINPNDLFYNLRITNISAQTADNGVINIPEIVMPTPHPTDKVSALYESLSPYIYQYSAPSNSSGSSNPSNSDNSENTSSKFPFFSFFKPFLRSIKEFFQRALDFIRNLFK